MMRCLRAGCFALVCSLVVAQGCASGNWMRFRAERYEAAEHGDSSVIRASTYDALTKIQSLSAKGQHVDALDQLSDLESAVQEVPHERALVAQAKAYVLMTMGRLHEAPPAIEAALEPGTLPEQTTQDLRYNLAQIYVQQEQFDKAAPVLELWVSESEAPEPEALALLAYIYVQSKDFALAQKYAKRALSLRPNHAPWQEILLTCQFEQKQYKGARRTLLALLGQSPLKPELWRTLTQLDLLLEHPADALASLELTQDLSQLQETEILQMVRLSLVQAMPSRGAVWLSEALQTQRVADSAAHWSLLGHAHLAAKDWESATQAFEQSLARMQDPQKKAALCLRLAGLGVRQGQWAQAQRHAKCASSSPQTQTRANGLLIDGIASYQQRAFARSLAALGSAQSYRATATSARQWTEMVRQQKANLALIDSVHTRSKAVAR